MRFIFAKIKGILAMATLVCIVCGMCSIFSMDGVAMGEVPNVQLIASFYTYYGESSDNRKHNVNLACAKIDGTVLAVEEEFSFNDVVGYRTEENGFKTAYIIKDGEFVEGVGGGVCQVSSTLYNAVLLADLTITRVQAHSLPVSYVAPSFDAMVSSGSDFRFVNTLSAPITIKMVADGKYVRCSIYGVQGRKVSRRSETVEVLPYETVYRDDENLLIGVESVESNGMAGLRSRGYLEYECGGRVVTKQIRTDTYAPQNRVVLRGTKETNSQDGKGQ
jgi:vancomycin resistance protein YoaR